MLAASQRSSGTGLQAVSMDELEMAETNTNSFGMSARPAPSPRGGTNTTMTAIKTVPVSAITETILSQARNKIPHATRIKPVKTDTVVGGVIPKYGFVLRTVLGYNILGSGSVCSRCPWLSGCHGCLLLSLEVSIAALLDLLMPSCLPHITGHWRVCRSISAELTRSLPIRSARTR